MITSFEVGAIFKIADMASPVLASLSRNVASFNVEIEKARTALASIGRMQGVARLSTQLAAATSQANALAAALGRVGALGAGAGAVRPRGAVPIVPGGGGPVSPSAAARAARGGGGIHMSGLSSGLPVPVGHAAVHMRGSGVGVLAAEGIGLWGLGKTMKAAEDYQHQMAMLKLSYGNAPDAANLLGASRDKAWEISRSVAGSTVGGNLATIGGMYSIVGAQNALTLAPKLAMMDQVLASVGKSSQEHGSSYVMTRAQELLGTMLNPETHQVDMPAFTRMMDLMTRVTIGTHGKVTPAEWLAFAKQAGPAAGNLTDEGFYTAAAVIQATSGQRAGTAMQAMNREFVGGVMPQRAAEELVRLGIAKPGDFETKRGGHIVAKTDAMSALVDKLQKDPLSAFVNEIIPALEKAGVTTKEQFQREIYKIFTTSTNQRLAWEIYRGRDQMAQERSRMMLSMSTGDAFKVVMGEDPKAVTRGFTAAFHNLLAAFGDPLLSAAVPNMVKLTHAMNAMQEVSRAHPEASATIGGAAITSALGAGAGWLVGRMVGQGGRGARYGAGLGGALGAYLGWSGYENSLKSDSMVLASAYGAMGAGDVGSGVHGSLAMATATRSMRAGFTFSGLLDEHRRKEAFEKKALPVKGAEYGLWGLELLADASSVGFAAKAVPYLSAMSGWANVGGMAYTAGLGLQDAYAQLPRTHLQPGQIELGAVARDLWRDGRSVHQTMRDEFMERRKTEGERDIKINVDLGGASFLQGLFDEFAKQLAEQLGHALTLNTGEGEGALSSPAASGVGN